LAFPVSIFKRPIADKQQELPGTLVHSAHRAQDARAFDVGHDQTVLIAGAFNYIREGAAIMNVLVKTFVAITCLTCFGVATLSTVAYAHDSGHPPYIVRGNTHILIGVTLDEAAVRAVLPAGMEPTEGITGGFNVYRSAGGYNTPAYTRAYVWADVEGYDSASGAKGRWVIWGVTGPGADLSQAEGYDFHDGSAALVERGMTIIGIAEQRGSKILRVEIELADGTCGPATGTLNYPVTLPATGKLAMHQYPFAGDVCGASPVSVEVMVGDDHPLNKFKPTSLLWAAQTRNLSFAGFTVTIE
jgi:hypothetical protein